MSEKDKDAPVAKLNGSAPSETNSFTDMTNGQSVNPDASIVVDANREVRAKLYMGEVGSLRAFVR